MNFLFLYFWARRRLGWPGLWPRTCLYPVSGGLTSKLRHDHCRLADQLTWILLPAPGLDFQPQTRTTAMPSYFIFMIYRLCRGWYSAVHLPAALSSAKYPKHFRIYIFTNSSFYTPKTLAPKQHQWLSYPLSQYRAANARKSTSLGSAVFNARKHSPAVLPVV